MPTFALVCAIREIGRTNREAFFTAALALSFGSSGGHIGRCLAYFTKVDMTK